MSIANVDRLIELRREFHRYPEPAWCEFYTTTRIIEEVERIGVDELYIGGDAVSSSDRWGVPGDPKEIDRWADRAIDAGADPDVVEQLRHDTTGVVAVLDRGQGPHIGLRVDMDALVRSEADTPEHHPAAEGFRSENDGYMHACGHDAHAAMGIGVLAAIADSDFSGRLTVGFQPAEEVIGGGRAMAESGHFDDVDQFFAVHVGLGHPTGTVIAGFDRFLAVSNVDVQFAGAGAHAGAEPEVGRNAIQALATAVQNLYAISRNSDGLTRINVGRVSGGTASNIIAENAHLEGEVRGGTTALREYMKERAETVVTAAAAMYDCDVEIEFGPEAPGADSDVELARIVESVAEGVADVDQVLPISSFRASEDATFLMEHVQQRGGQATFVGIGTDTPGGHHTATFDVDETSIRIGVDVLSRSILRVEERR